jgi:hypothetical protein
MSKILDFIDKNFKCKKEVICTICLDKINENNVKLICNHNFHKKCLDKWLSINNSCPLCRCNVNSNIIIGKVFNHKITPSKYPVGDCGRLGHTLIIDKPYGVVITCKTCGIKRCYNWKK